MDSKRPAGIFPPHMRFSGRAAELFGKDALFRPKIAADKTGKNGAATAATPAADGGGSDDGAMQAAIHDPQGKKADAFAVENMNGTAMQLRTFVPEGANKEDIKQVAQVTVM